ncbi:hypothetical protein BTA51_10385 [Hahella sp. CCB-MM4]|uniref:acyltransferase family protein n=1 Tax=Hahella sp. (strain CCB-MM4) TaxID=1926491 RepID=UPI000BD4878F|nr:acyltransferase [Hahella sp. CCB-MM4]OZG73424.1 hypothetical protein BTA51_10385 [Hahella sp. CCB-MM4]
MFLGYIHSFRALAIFFIVAGHAIDAFVWDDGSNLERALRILVSNGSTLFVFIAGYLFQHLSYKYQTRKYLSSKIKNVILPYLIISIPAIAIFVFVMHRQTVWQGFYDNPTWLQVFYFYITGKHLAPLWFVPMITLFYVVAPLLMVLDKNKKVYYLLPIFVVLSCFVGRGYAYASFAHFFSVYLLGMFCSRYKVELNPKLSSNSTLMITGIGVIVLALYEFYFMKGTMTYINFLQKTLMSLFFLGLFIRLGERIESKFIGIVADTSFGIFFIHSYILTGGKMTISYFNGTLVSGNVFIYSLVAIATLLFCVLIILTLKRMLGHYSRYIIGS